MPFNPKWYSRDVKSIGCLVVAYQRPVELQRVLESLKSQHFHYIFISIDFPSVASVENLSRMMDVISVAEEFAKDRNDVTILRREVNFGIITNFRISIDECFRHVDLLCVLEDDCIPASGVMNYLEKVSDKQFDECIKLYSLTRPPFFEQDCTFALTHSPLMWGWAISRANWIQISALIDEFHSFRFFSFPQVLFQSFHYSGYVRAMESSHDALDAIIAYLFLARNFMTLIPPVNMVSNIGTGEHATNTRNRTEYHFSKTFPWEDGYAVDFPTFSKAQIFINDFRIYRRMNGWKWHHFASNYLKLKFTFHRRNK